MTSKYVSEAGKTLLRNTIQSTDFQNRVCANKSNFIFVNYQLKNFFLSEKRRRSHVEIA